MALKLFPLMYYLELNDLLFFISNLKTHLQTSRYLPTSLFQLLLHYHLLIVN